MTEIQATNPNIRQRIAVAGLAVLVGGAALVGFGVSRDGEQSDSASAQDNELSMPASPAETIPDTTVTPAETSTTVELDNSGPTPKATVKKGSTSTSVAPEIRSTPITPDTVPTVNPNTSMVEPGKEADPSQPKRKLDKPILSEKAVEYMRADTAYAQEFRHTVSVIRDSKDMPVGVATVEHGGLDSQRNPRRQGSDGKTYIDMTPVAVSQGPAHGEMQNMDQRLTNFMVPSTTDTTHDFAIGAFGNNKAGDVMDLYLQNRLDPSSLKLGDTMYWSGFPDKQPNNPYSAKAQEVAVRVLGTGTAETAKEKLKVVWTLMPKTADGAGCTSGASGAEGFVIIDGKKRSVGTLAGVVSLNADETTTAGSAKLYRERFERDYGVDTTGFDFGCAFTNEADLGPGAQVVYTK